MTRRVTLGTTLSDVENDLEKLPARLSESDLDVLVEISKASDCDDQLSLRRVKQRPSFLIRERR